MPLVDVTPVSGHHRRHLSCKPLTVLHRDTKNERALCCESVSQPSKHSSRASLHHRGDLKHGYPTPWPLYNTVAAETCVCNEPILRSSPPLSRNTKLKFHHSCTRILVSVTRGQFLHDHHATTPGPTIRVLPK